MNLFKRLITLAVFSSAIVGWVGAEAIPPIDKTPVIVFINGKKYYIHTVKAGDTLYSIAKAYEVSEAAIKECNPSSADGLKIDQTIKIPVPEKVQAEARAEAETLAAILTTNLLKNAFVHTAEQGHIRIHIDDGRFEICNTAEGGALDRDQIFNRFYQGSKKEHSTGLGLAIVATICKIYAYRIDYIYKENSHCFIFSCE